MKQDAALEGPKVGVTKNTFTLCSALTPSALLGARKWAYYARAVLRSPALGWDF